jgi:hypothetical protein
MSKTKTPDFAAQFDPTKHVAIVPAGSWGKADTAALKRIRHVNEHIATSFETDCIEGWVNFGDAWIGTDKGLSVVYMVVESEPKAGITREAWHLSCVRLRYMIGATIPDDAQLLVALPGEKRFLDMTSDEAVELLVETVETERPILFANE